MTGVSLPQATVYFGSTVGGSTPCTGLFECSLAVLLDAPVLWIGISLIPMLLMTVGYLRAARDAVTDEIELTASERDAFRAFGERVAELESDPVGRQPAGLISYDETGQAETADRIVEAYRETVLDTDRHERVYGESAEQNMRAELGDDVASVILGEGSVGPQTQRLVVARAGQAAHLREQFLETLRDELDQIEVAERELANLVDRLGAVGPGGPDDPPNHDMVDDLETLDRIEDRCEDIARRRQDRIHTSPDNRRLGAREESTNLQEYLYSSLSVTYPVLASVAKLLDDIQYKRDSVLHGTAG